MGFCVFGSDKHSPSTLTNNIKRINNCFTAHLKELNVLKSVIALYKY